MVYCGYIKHEILFEDEPGRHKRWNDLPAELLNTRYFEVFEFVQHARRRGCIKNKRGA